MFDNIKLSSQSRFCVQSCCVIICLLNSLIQRLQADYFV